MYKKDLALNDLQWLICHKNQTNQQFCHQYKLCVCVYIIYIYYIYNILYIEYLVQLNQS